MKVKISSYRYRWVSAIHCWYMDRKYGKFKWDESENTFERALEKVEDGLQWVYNHSINLILDRRKSQKIRVRIDRWDTWSMDHTLSHIIVPMLVQLKQTEHGAPFVDDEDVPEDYRSTSAPSKENDYDLDDNHFKRWDYVLDEMIWAFEQKQRGDWESDYYEFADDPKGFLGLKMVSADDEGRKAHQARMTNGFRLFGKYYEALWD